MEEVVVHEEAPQNVSSRTLLRWIGEIPIEREAELAKLFAIQTSSDKERLMVKAVASWFSGTDVVEDEQQVEEEKKEKEEAMPAQNSSSDGFEQELKSRLAKFKDSEQISISEFVAKYNIIRVTSPTLLALGPGGIEVLQFCGFASDGSTYLKASDRERLRRARELIEASRAAQNTSTVVSPDWFLAAHGAYVKHKETSVPFGFFDSIGRRPEMEDEACAIGDVFAVFDGHAGANAAKLCAAALASVLANQLAKVDDDWTKGATATFAELHHHVTASRILSGTTALVAKVRESKVCVAHVGDSRAVLVKSDGKALRVTEDHKPENPVERARIVASGGRVVKSFFSNVYRVNGELSVARAIGDLPYVQFGVTNAPECVELPRSADMFALILACDGIWDVLKDEDAAKLVFGAVNDGLSMEGAAQKLVETAFKKQSMDNLSVLIIDLRRDEMNNFL